MNLLECISWIGCPLSFSNSIPIIYLSRPSEGGEREEDLVPVEGVLYLLFLKLAIEKYLLIYKYLVQMHTPLFYAHSLTHKFLMFLPHTLLFSLMEIHSPIMLSDLFSTLLSLSLCFSTHTIGKEELPICTTPKSVESPHLGKLAGRWSLLNN